MTEKDFINEALRRGIIQFDQVQEALKIQEQAAREGTPPKIWEILVSRELADKAHVEAVLAGQPPPKTVTFGPFEIKGKLGEGGAGAVFLATKEGSKEEIALKVLPERFSEPAMVGRFELEAQAGIALSHPNLVKGHEFGKVGNRYYYSMEYVKGKTVGALIREKGKLDEKPALQIVIQVTYALSAIQELHLVHRDVKPDNIIIAEDGTVKLMDLGLIKSTGEESQALTQVGKMVGTLVYSAPEQFRLEPVDVRTDIYSLGISLYHMLTGRVPASAKSPAEVLQGRRAKGRFDPREERAELSEGVSRVVLKMTAWRPEHRYQNPQELLGDLHLVLAGKAPKMVTEGTQRLPVGFKSTTRTQAVQRSTQILTAAGSKRKLILAAGGIACVAAVLAIVAAPGKAKPKRDSAAVAPIPAPAPNKSAPLPGVDAAMGVQIEQLIATGNYGTAMREIEAFEAKNPQFRRDCSGWRDQVTAAAWGEFERLRQEVTELVSRGERQKARDIVSQARWRFGNVAGLDNALDEILTVGARAAPLPAPAPSPAPAPVGADPVLEAADRLLKEAKTLYEAATANRSVAGLNDAGFKAEEARTKYAAVQDLLTGDARQHAANQLSVVIQLMRLINDAKKGLGSPAPASPTPRPAAPGTLAPLPPVPGTLPPVPTPVPEQKPAAEPPAVAESNPPAAKKAPVPSMAAQKAALKDVQEVLKDEYAQTSPAGRARLVDRLLELARQSKGDAASQFVLFREAGAILVQQGEYDRALEITGELGGRFEVDLAGMKLAMLEGTPQQAKSPEALKTLAIAGASLADELVWADKYDLAEKASALAVSAARKAKDIPLVYKAEAKARQVLELKRRYGEAIKAGEVLASKPDDAAANQAVGYFRCLLKGDWESGLGFLAKGTDPSLREIASKDLVGTDDPQKMVEIADRWWDLGEKNTGAPKETLRRQAARWYERAKDRLTGLVRMRAEKRISESGFTGEPPGPAVAAAENRNSASLGRRAQPINLLSLINPKRDSVSGAWTLDGTALIVPGGPGPKLQIPCIPPEEYDLRIVVSRKSGIDFFGVGLVGGGRQFIAALDMAGKSDLDTVDGGGKTFYGATVLGDGRERTILYSVRKDRVIVSADGQPVIDWKAEYERVGVRAIYQVPNPKVLFLTAWNSEFRISQLWLTPLSGQALQPDAPSGPGFRDLTEDMSVWQWDAGGTPSGTVGRELVFSKADRQPFVQVEPINLLLGKYFTLRFKLRYEIDGRQEPWVFILFKGARPMRGLMIFPEGDHSVAFATRASNSAWQFRETQRLPQGKPRPKTWMDFELVWHDSSKRLALSMDGHKAFNFQFQDGTALDAPWGFGLGGAAREVRIKEVFLRNEDGESGNKPPADSGAVNLLNLIDTSKDTVSGRWNFDPDGTLRCPQGKQARRLQIPYIPPEEYDVKVVLARRFGGDFFGMGLVGGDRQFIAAVDVGGFAGLDTVDGKGIWSNETAVQKRVFMNAESKSIVYTVRKTRVAVSVDGSTILDWKADYKRVGLGPSFTMPNDRALFLVAWDTDFQISRLSLLPVSEQGQRLR